MTATVNTATLGLLALSLGAWSCHSPVERVFAFSTDGPSRTGLVETSSGVVIGNDVGNVILLSYDGKPLWRVQLPRGVLVRPAVAADTVVVATEGGEWLGLSLAAGKERWRLAGQHRLLAPLATDGSHVYAVAGNGTILAIDPESGGVAWASSTGIEPDPDLRRLPQPVVAGDLLITALDQAGLLALRTSTGEPAWRLTSLQALGMVLSGSRLYAVSRLGEVMEIDAAQGKPRWSRPLGEPALGGPWLAAGLLWVGREGNMAVALQPEDGTERFHTLLPGPLVAGVVAYRDLVLVPTAGREGRLVGLRPREGGERELLFEARMDSPMRSAPVVRGDEVLLPLADGRVIGVRVKPPAAR